METINLTIELLHRSIEIGWSTVEHPHRFARWRGATCVNRSERSGKGGGDGTADEAQRACCHHILRVPDCSHIGDVL